MSAPVAKGDLRALDGLDEVDEGSMKPMVRKILAFLLLFLGAPVMADDTPRVLFEFTGADAAKEWQTVNDGVMGGVSEGKFKITDARTLEFFGHLALGSNGGFASVRTRARKLGLERGETLLARVRGDAREYSLHLYVGRPLVTFSASDARL